jgi:hypothetical protein
MNRIKELLEFTEIINLFPTAKQLIFEMSKILQIEKTVEGY